MGNSIFWNNVDQEVSKFDLLQHPFYRAWSAGELTFEDLRFYAEQYYHQVSQFPTYLTALHARLPEGEMRRAVLRNAYEEECEACAHSELWLRFVEGMGGTGAHLDENLPIVEIRELVGTFQTMAKDGPIARAFGALFAYESQVPRIATEKLSGLKRHYGAGELACTYFALHRFADVHHANVWRNIISTLIEEDDCHIDQVLDGVSRAASALWTALDGIERERLNCKGGSCVSVTMN